MTVYRFYKKVEKEQIAEQIMCMQVRNYVKLLQAHKNSETDLGLSDWLLEEKESTLIDWDAIAGKCYEELMNKLLELYPSYASWEGIEDLAQFALLHDDLVMEEVEEAYLDAVKNVEYGELEYTIQAYKQGKVDADKLLKVLESIIKLIN